VSALRNHVATAVAARTPVDAREAESIPRFLAELARLAEPFSEIADPVHVTGSAIVVGPRGVVLHLHKRLGLWLQPGGHIEPGESPWAGAEREAEEETGLAVEHPEGTPLLVHVDVHPGPRGHTHLDLRYLLVSGPAEPRPPLGESQAVAWFDWAEARRITDPGLAGALAALDPAEAPGGVVARLGLSLGGSR
jgi:8-oxo-dGTP pyrophosphatase MutT (NUDIX family)